jgi:hypothetical protein
MLKLALLTMAGILNNFFEVSFYDAFTHNYSLFTLLFKPLLFLSSLYKFYQRFMIKLKNI